jgi:hypothetical protein
MSTAGAVLPAVDMLSSERTIRDARREVGETLL